MASETIRFFEMLHTFSRTLAFTQLILLLQLYVGVLSVPQPAIYMAMVGGRKWPPPPPPPSPCGRRGRVAFLRVRNRERLQTQDKAQQCCMARFLSVSQSARVCVCVSVCDAFPVGWLCIQSADGRPPGHPLLGGQCAWPQLPVVLYVIATAVSHPARYVCSTVRWTLFPITLPLARVQSLLPSACLYVGNMPNGSEPQNQRVQTPQKILCTCYLWPWSFLF